MSLRCPVPRLAALVLVLTALCVLPFSAQAQEKPETEAPWNYISLKACGVDAFLAEHPTYDGRGVVVFVLDNGAEIGAPGLLKTTEGETKFIDAQDFTGEGDVKLTKVTLTEGGVFEIGKKGPRILDGGSMPFKAAGGAWYGGVLKESRFLNSEFAGAVGSTDVNDNGRDDDVFAVLAFPLEGEDHWVVVVDTDLDGELADEKPLRSMRDRPEDRLVFTRKLPDRQEKRMVLAPTIFPAEKKVTFHYASGAHSTHVSGIVAGQAIDGRPGYNGIAPGAKLVSLKIGDCTLAGGATVRESMKKAYEYARDWHLKHKVPVVCNMSYGIGSEIEGTTDIDRFLDGLCFENPGVVVCTSAGNAGPGLSTVGTPAAAPMVMSVGAVLAQDVARNVYNAALDGHRLLHFSSRGGELDKPDFAAPGACFSSVPLWRPRATMWGTSMASPYAAGVAALLVSAAMQEYPGVEVTSTMIRRALKNSCRPLDYCNALDQGSGMIRVPEAWRILKTYLENAKAGRDPVAGYTIETFCPEGAGGKARAAYWRSSYRPGPEYKQVFDVKARFRTDATKDEIKNFFRKYTLVSEAPFVRLIPESVALRQDGTAPVTLTFRPEMLEEPGVHTGRVAAYDGAPKPENRAFDLLATVIVPHVFGPEKGYRFAVEDGDVAPLEVDHHYLAVPAGASSMVFRFAVPDDAFALARIELDDPEGRTLVSSRGLDTANGVRETSITVSGDDLVPGVWELLVYGDFRSGAVSRYEASVEFFGVETLDAPGLGLDFEPGRTPQGTVTLMNRFDRAVWTEAEGSVWGYTRTREIAMKGKDRFTYTFRLDDGLAGVDFEVKVSPEDYGLFTDFAVNILDAKGKALSKGGLNNRSTSVHFANPGKGAYTLELVAGYALGEKAPFTVELKEDFRYARTLPLKLSALGAGGTIPLVTDIPAEVEYRFDSVPSVAPKGFATAATITFTERGTGKRVKTMTLTSGE